MSDTSRAERSPPEQAKVSAQWPTVLNLAEYVPDHGHSRMCRSHPYNDRAMPSVATQLLILLTLAVASATVLRGRCPRRRESRRQGSGGPLKLPAGDLDSPTVLLPAPMELPDSRRHVPPGFNQRRW